MVQWINLNDAGWENKNSHLGSRSLFRSYQWWCLSQSVRMFLVSSWSGKLFHGSCWKIENNNSELLLCHLSSTNLSSFSRIVSTQGSVMSRSSSWSWWWQCSWYLCTGHSPHSPLAWQIQGVPKKHSKNLKIRLNLWSSFFGTPCR